MELGFRACGPFPSEEVNFWAGGPSSVVVLVEVVVDFAGLLLPEDGTEESWESTRPSEVVGESVRSITAIVKPYIHNGILLFIICGHTITCNKNANWD